MSSTATRRINVSSNLHFCDALGHFPPDGEQVLSVACTVLALLQRLDQGVAVRFDLVFHRKNLLPLAALFAFYLAGFVAPDDHAAS